jgi:GNAT superfamily N-acetyltransferase
LCWRADDILLANLAPIRGPVQVVREGEHDGMNSDDFHIRSMGPAEIALAVDWAAAEGWNPGLADAGCFGCVDPAGFLIGEHAGQAASTISVVNYDERFAFLGSYIVRPDLRGRGLGLRTWQAAIAHAGARTIGLDGVVAQQDNYRKSGFAFAYNNIRYGGVPENLRIAEDAVPLSTVPFELIERDDATVFPAARPAFLRNWIAAAGHVGRALLRDDRLVAWGVIRPCRHGRKVGPLFADDRAAAEAVLAALVGEESGEIFLDTPQPNKTAVALAEAHGLAPVFQTARMYSGPIRPVALERVFGVTTFELG